MQLHQVRTHKSSELLPRQAQLAWKIAEVAADPVGVEPDVAEMIGNRLIDNAAVAAASLARRAPANARAQALAHRKPAGANIFGLPADEGISPEWAAWANGVAVRELDYHDTFLSLEWSHPGDNIPAIVAVAQHCRLGGDKLVRGIATGYEIQVDLCKGMCLHEHKIDHIAHLGPSIAAGLGALLDLPTETTWQAIQQALHVTTTTRQSRKGEISSWKAYAPAFAGKMAVEAIDRAMRGETAPTPAYEGEDGFIAWLLSGPDALYHVPLPEPGEPKRAILDTYTKEHSAEIQGQAFIDLAKRMRRQPLDLDRIQEIVIETSYHTHVVIGSGANDPQKMNPDASRETLDHSVMYMFAAALQDGEWHHERSYAPDRARRPDTVALWRKIRTMETAEWSRRYHATDAREKALGGRAIIRFDDGTTVEDEIAVADAHPLGARPFKREHYIAKFRTLADGVVARDEQDRYLELVSRLAQLTAAEVIGLTLSVDPALLGGPRKAGLFDRAL